MRSMLAYIHAALRVSETSLFLRRLPTQRSFDDWLEELREGEPFPAWARDPRPYASAAYRLGSWLPPRDLGPCMKRSLILLHLWSRCGFEPELHLGVRRGGDDRFQAHAWLSAKLPDGRQIATGRSGFDSAFAFPAQENPGKPLPSTDEVP